MICLNSLAVFKILEMEIKRISVNKARIILFCSQLLFQSTGYYLAMVPKENDLLLTIFCVPESIKILVLWLMTLAMLLCLLKIRIYERVSFGLEALALICFPLCLMIILIPDAYIIEDPLLYAPQAMYDSYNLV